MNILCLLPFTQLTEVQFCADKLIAQRTRCSRVVDRSSLIYITAVHNKQLNLSPDQTETKINTHTTILHTCHTNQLYTLLLKQNAFYLMNMHDLFYRCKN